jgi:hypothetical protein
MLVRLSLELVQHARGRNQVMAPHLLGKTGQFPRPFVELSPGHKGAAALLPPDIARLGQLGQRLPHGYLTDLKALSQLLFAWQTFVGAPAAGLDLRLEDVQELVI